MSAEATKQIKLYLDGINIDVSRRGRPSSQQKNSNAERKQFKNDKNNRRI